MVQGSQTIRLTYLPLALLEDAASPLVAVRARYAQPRRGEIALQPMASEVAWAFSLPGSWTTLDCMALDFVSDTGELTLPYNVSWGCRTTKWK